MAKSFSSALALALLAFPLISASPHPAITPAPAVNRRADFECHHAADPSGGMGFCPAVGAAGWCECSDFSTYAMADGDDPCPYTTPPPSGPTTLASEDCGTTTVKQTINVIPIPAATSTSAPKVEGAPDDQVSCPVPLKPDTNQYFTKEYVTDNIVDIINYGKLKGSYPKPFNPKSDKADQFDWTLNNCNTRQDGGETILELPMYLENGKETYWSQNSASNNNKPGPYREYYILKDRTATYCGAYAHKDLSANGDFVACS